MRIKEAIELLKGVIYERNAIISYSSELPEIYIKEKVALEEAVKVLKRYNRLMQVKAKPVKQRIKIQYEGEELKKQLADIQPVQHGRWIPEDEYYEDSIYICSACGHEFIIADGDLESNELNYCPRCGAKMDDKDINVPTKSGMEEEDDG